MSNIPSSAMPHAWAPDNDDEDDDADREASSGLPSLVTLAGVGALLYLVYRAVR